MAQRYRTASVLHYNTVTGRAVPPNLHLSLQSWCGTYFRVCSYQLSYVGRRSAQKGCEAINPLNAELNPICQLLALLGAHQIFHVSGLRVNSGRISGLTNRPMESSSFLNGGVAGYVWSFVRFIQDADMIKPTER
jgi:hypothetical protein